MSRPLILYTGNFDSPMVNAAGKRVYGNALALKKLGYDIELLGKSLTHPGILHRELCNGIRFSSFPNYGVQQVGRYISYVENFIATMKDRLVMIIRYGSPSIAFFDKMLNRMAELREIPLIADVVDWLPSGGGNVLFKTIKTIDTYLEKARYNSQSNGIIAISSYLANYYQSSVSSIATIPPLVESYRRNQSYNDKITLCYAGAPFRFGRKIEKSDEMKDRLDLTIVAVCNAISRGAKLCFNIYGLSDAQYLTAFPAHRFLLKESEGSIFFHGQTEMTEVQHAVNHSDFTILMRDITRGTMAGFPTKVVESLSQGTPVITTRTSDLDKYLHDGLNSFFVEAGSADYLSDKLCEICDMDYNSIARLKSACYDSGDFLPDRFTKAFGDLIATVR